MRHRVDMEIPASSGNYAPEILYLAAAGVEPPSNVKYSAVRELVLILKDLPTSAEIEVDVQDHQSNWITAVSTAAEDGVFEPIYLLDARGVRVRGKSGGTSGTAIVMAIWR